MRREKIKTNVNNLYTDAIYVKPVDFDWSQGYGETWEIVLPDPADWSAARCRKWLDNGGYSYPPDSNPFILSREELADQLQSLGRAVPDDETPEQLAETLFASLDTQSWGDGEDWRNRVRELLQEDAGRYRPAGNYYYPLPDAPRDPGKLAGLFDEDVPFILIHFKNTNRYALAPTGDNTDLSWETCQAYMLAKYLPPLFLCRLTAYPEPLTPGHEQVLQACRRTIEVVMRQAEAILIALKHTEESMAQFTPKPGRA
ncbi:MAG: hypothetical protein AB1426_11165 [Bacillota bacterium]